jgi:hypothetical protein
MFIEQFVFSASAQPSSTLFGDDDELLMEFCVCCFLLHNFLFIAAALLPGRLRDDCLQKKNKSLRPSQIQDSNYEFTIFNGAVWAMR